MKRRPRKAKRNSRARYARVFVAFGTPLYGLVEVSPDGDRWRLAGRDAFRRFAPILGSFELNWERIPLRAKPLRVRHYRFVLL